ncbi:AAA family ATPase [Gorillibacterium sp. sgz5001074]|uniref:AAA family ATPase n=1 Tax=Gorillibacterium sp. sgz5001074 TaxID=3446695 RepID=UPI003F671F58
MNGARQPGGRPVQREAEEGTRGRTILFTGTTPNIGTTVLAFGTAVRLAERSDTPVGYLCLNLKSSKLHRYLGKEETYTGLDTVRAEMRAGSLYAGRLKSYFEPVKDAGRLEILYGANQREQAEFYLPADIRHLLKIVRESYPLCIIEVNACWDNAATIAASMEADAKVLVTTPDLGHFQEDMTRWVKTVAPLFGVEPDSFLLAVTQWQPGRTGGIKPADIRKEAGMELAATVAYDPELREWLNQGRLLEYVTRTKPFLQSVESLADLLVAQLGIRIGPGGAATPAGRLRSWMPMLHGR